MASNLQPVPKHLVILRRRDVQARTGLSRSTLYLRISQNSFPKSISLGGRTVGWLESEVEDWLAQQVVLSRKV